jgi:aspartyl-tRNA(Asn)/glutamyl-tRNA(Gln) amidotransferase subunit A
MYLADIYTLPASLAGIAGLSVPCGMAKATATQPALPVGLQLLAPAFVRRAVVSTLAAAVERLTSPGGPALPPAADRTP